MVIIFHFVGSKIITIKDNAKKKKDPVGKRFCADLKYLIDNTDSDKNTDGEEIDVTHRYSNSIKGKEAYKS